MFFIWSSLDIMNVSGDQGTVRAKHKLSFDLVLPLNTIIRQLRLELKTWRKVFWRLWGICHAFVCCLCGQPFQVSLEYLTTYHLPSPQFYMLEFCSYHPTEPEFPAIQFKNSTLPLGEFPCCGETAVRFQPIAQVSNTLASEKKP